MAALPVVAAGEGREPINSTVSPSPRSKSPSHIISSSTISSSKGSYTSEASASSAHSDVGNARPRNLRPPAPLLSSSEPISITKLSSSAASQSPIFKSTPAALPKDSIVSSSQLHSPLIITSPSAASHDTGPRSALFDDHVASAHVPGSLHLAPDSIIQRLVERQGVVTLVRQLAEDLAHRDRELVSFRRRAEERERALKKMLVEVEVSNADIEKRLAACTLQKKISRETLRSGGDSASYTESIDEMMQQALCEDDEFSVIEDCASGMNMGEDDESMIEDILTPRTKVRLRKPSQDCVSLSLNPSTSKRSSIIRGWKGFFWGGQPSHVLPVDDKTVKAPRWMPGPGNIVKRRILSAETFHPPQPTVSPNGERSLSYGSSIASLSSIRSHSSSLQKPAGRAPPPTMIYTQHHFALDKSQPRLPHLKPLGSSLSGQSQQAHEHLGDPVQRKTSISPAHWALQRVSQGTPTQEQENVWPMPPPVRPRSRSTPDGHPGGSLRRPSLSMTDNLQRKAWGAAQKQHQAAKTRSRAPSTVVSFSSQTTPKSNTFFQDIRDTAERIVPLGNNSQNVASKLSDDVGPVEMETIIPQEDQPPTLLQGWNQHYATDYLTDRFGFIYDKQQRTVSIKGANSIEGSYTERKPTEESSKTESSTTAVNETSTGSTTNPNDVSEWSELVYGPSSLSVVSPAAPAILCKTTTATTITAATATATNTPTTTTSTENHKTTHPESAGSLVKRLSRPGAAVSSPISVTSVGSAPQLATLSQVASGTTSTAEESTVRLLLGQLSDLYDSLQRDRTVKWNEFLRKVRLERRRCEDDENGMPETLMTGELIGVATLGTEGRGGKQRWKEFKNLVLRGIPVTYRWKIWTECSGATSMKVPGYYEDLLQNGQDDPPVISQIVMDINRTLTDNIFFRKGPGVSRLKQVLLAYSRRNQEVGYCQGMNAVAASLLLIMPSEEDAFWVLCSIIERILPKTYFEPNLLASRADQRVLKYYVEMILPSLHTHLQNLGVELEALTFQWFLSIFTDTLAAEALFRVWDVVLCIAGSDFLFQVAIALLRLNEKALLGCETAAEVYSYLNGGMIHQGISIDGLIRESDALKKVIRKPDVEKRRELAIKQELGEWGEVGHRHSDGQITDNINSQRKASVTSDAGSCGDQNCGAADSSESSSDVLLAPSIVGSSGTGDVSTN